MNIFTREWKAHRKSLVIWSMGILFMVVGGMGKFAGMSSSGQSMNDLMMGMPTSLQAIMGTGVLDLSKASGYYGVLYLYLIVMTTVHAVMIGANIISKEERDQTSEFLFVKPISRKKIMTYKLLAALTNIAVINFMSIVTSIFVVTAYSKGEERILGDITLLMSGMFILQLLFLMIGSSLAAILKQPKKAPSMATGILLFTFILSIGIDLNERLEVLKYITPFKYFEAKHVMYGGGLDERFVILSVFLIASLLAVTYVFFQKRDLKN
jgi:ABC-2 type transport system permease protein